MTEVGAVLVGGGELHDRWSSLCRTSAPLRRGIQRLHRDHPGDGGHAPSLEDVLPPLAELLRGEGAWSPTTRRSIVAYCARRSRASASTGPTRRSSAPPRWRGRCCRSSASAASACSPTRSESRSTPPTARWPTPRRARGCCARSSRGCARTRHDRRRLAARAALAPTRRPTTAPAPSCPGARGRPPAAPPGAAEPEFGELPRDPGVYLFRDMPGEVLYVGKSVSIRSRARAHFAPSSPPAALDRACHGGGLPDDRFRAGRAHAGEPADQGAPPARQQAAGPARRPARLHPLPSGHPLPDPRGGARPRRRARRLVGPVRGRRLALELVEQLDSLFGLRHCGRRLPRREYPSAYGQMGRCLSPCLGDLDPNLYRRRLDAVLALFVGAATRGGAAARPCRRARCGPPPTSGATSARPAAPPRGRLPRSSSRLGGVLEATHARPRLVLAAHPDDPAPEAFWLAGGRLVDWPPAGPRRRRADGAHRGRACDARGGPASRGPRPARRDRRGADPRHLAVLPPGTPQLVLARRRTVTRSARCRSELGGAAGDDPGGVRRRSEGELDDDGVDLVGADHDL